MTQIDPNDSDKDDVFKQNKALMRVMNLAINNFLTLFAYFTLNPRYTSTMILMAIYMFFVCYLVNDKILPLQIVSNFRIFSIILLIGWTLIIYIDERESKKNF